MCNDSALAAQYLDLLSQSTKHLDDIYKIIHEATISKTVDQAIDTLIELLQTIKSKVSDITYWHLNISPDIWKVWDIPLEKGSKIDDMVIWLEEVKNMSTIQDMKDELFAYKPSLFE